MSIAGVFGLDLRLFLAQLVNFGLLVFILWKVLYGPLTKFMQDRSERIASGLEKEKEYAEKLNGVEQERQAALQAAEQERRTILIAAQDEAKRIEAQAKVAAEVAMNEARAKMATEAKQAQHESLEQMRAQAADLVILAAEKVLREKIDEKTDRALVEKALKEVTL